MSSSNTLLLLLSLAAGLAGLIFGLLQRSRSLTQTTRLAELEGQTRNHSRDLAGLRTQLDLKLGEVKALEDANRSLKLQADTASRAAREPVPAAPKPEKKDKAQEKTKVMEVKLRELEQQLSAEQRKAERFDRQVRQRDEDVRLLQLELQDLRQALEASQAPKSQELREISDRPAAKLPPLKVPQQPDAAPAPEPKKAEVAPVTPEPANNQALESLREELSAAIRARSDANARVNLLELEARQLRERVEKREILFKELVGKVRELNHAKQKAEKMADTYPRLYAGLKGRYDLALDLIHAFRTKYNEVLPMELDIEIGRAMEEYLAYAEQEDRSRPRRAEGAPEPRPMAPEAEARPARAPRKGGRGEKGSSKSGDAKTVNAAPGGESDSAAKASSGPTEQPSELAQTSTPLESFTDAITHAIEDGIAEESGTRASGT